MNYTQDNRGIIQYQRRFHQAVDFKGLRFENITPTDIDGFVEYRGKVFILFKFKHVDATYDINGGQMKALTMTCDAIQTDSRHAMILLCRHDKPPHMDIVAYETLVEAVYHKRVWWDYRPFNRTAGEVFLRIMEKNGR